MQFAFPLHQRRKVGRALVVGLMLALWLGANLLTLSPCLHHWLHKDSPNVSHHCLITQLGKTPWLAGWVALPPLAPPPANPGWFCFIDSWKSGAADYRLSPSRAPPFLNSSIQVAG